MQTNTQHTERRREIRSNADDVIRWKRPGRIEDHKAWTLDRSVSGIGFVALKSEAPVVGEILHVRRLDGDCWVSLAEEIRVARTTAATDDTLVNVGCRIFSQP